MSLDFSKIDLDRINSIRKEKLKKFWMLFGACVLGFIAWEVISVSQEGTLFVFPAFLGFIGFVIGIFISSKVINDFKNKVKNEIFAEYKGELGLEHYPDKFIEEEVFKSTGLFTNNYDDYEGSDLIMTDDFKVSYLRVTKKEEDEDSEGNRHSHTVTIFNGYFYIFKFSSDISSPILIKRNTIHISDYLPIFASKTRVRMDNPEFEKLYDVYCEDKISANLFLDHNRMQKFLDNHSKIEKFCKIYVTNSTIYTCISTGETPSSAVPFLRDITIDDIEKIFYSYNMGIIFKHVVID